MSKKYLTLGPYVIWLKLQLVKQHKLAYLDYGDVNNPNVLICAHGLTRNAYDFEKIARVMQNNFRVIAIDYPGRGDSDYFTDKKSYNYYVYLKDTLLLLKKLKIKNPFWLGTSMGGIIGMAIGCFYPRILRGLILNDIGPSMPLSTVKKIGKYASLEPKFIDLELAKQHLKMIYKESGIKEEEDWNFLTKNSFKINSSNQYQMNYDPTIVSGMEIDKAKSKDVDMWKIWRKIKCPILVIHGAKSNILSVETVEKMQQSKQIDIYVVDYAGHAPALTNADQIDPIKNWLNKLIK